MIEGLVIAIGFILVVLGLAGSILPILPGPPLSFVGLFLLALLKHFSPPLKPIVMIILAVITVLAVALDYIIPLLGAKKFGASKWGIWGSVIGMIIGIFWSPFGMLIGAFIGAVAAEWFIGKKKAEALKAGWGVLIGTLSASILRLGISGVMTYYFILALWR